MPDQPTYPGSTSALAPGTGTFGVAPELLPLPELSEMVKLSNADLWATLQRHGVAQNWTELIAEAGAYNRQFSHIDPSVDQEGFNQQVADLLDLNPRDDGRPSRGMLSLARRTQERYTTMEAIDGNPAQELIRISTGDVKMCSGCAAAAGFIGTYAEHSAEGLPGEQQCGGHCRCQNVAVD